MSNPFPFKTGSSLLTGSVGVDCTATLGSAQVQELEAGLYRFAMRNCAGVTDATFIADMENCLKAGLSCGIYQGDLPYMWTEGTSFASSRGNEAVHRAQIVGYPTGGTIYLNVEGAGTYDHGPNGIPDQTVIDWINAWEG